MIRSCVAALVLMFAYSASTYAEEGKAPETKTVTYNVKGMMCGACVKAVTGAFKKVEGVTEVVVDEATNTAKITFVPAKTNVETLGKALEGTKFKCAPEEAKKG
jgi:copper chaperone CopZ